MTLFKAMDPEMEVNGQTVLSVADAFKVVKNMGLKLLEKHGFTDVQPDGWYKQQDWLDTFKEIHEKMGPITLFQIGKKIPENAKFPPEIDTVEKALASIDVAYHMNHGKRGKPLFNPETGEMQEGIGHYAFEKTGEGEATITCDNPYPDEFDRGIIEAMAKRFADGVQVEIDENEGTREQGKERTIYKISWRA